MIILLFLCLFSYQAFSQNSSSMLTLENQIRNTQSEYKSSIEFAPLQSQRKSPALAILYSFLLPGMGELYAGNYSSGKYFTIADGALWLTLFGFDSYANWQKNRYTSYAESFGGVAPSGKSDDYYAAIGEFQNIYDYNNKMALDRRFSKMYDEQLYYWDWQTNTNRRNYREMWVSSEQAFNNVRFVVGTLILNRLASAVFAVRAVARHNRNLSSDESWNIMFGLDNASKGNGVTINFVKNF
jgi:hypothetical protein